MRNLLLLNLRLCSLIFVYNLLGWLPNIFLIILLFFSYHRVSTFGEILLHLLTTGRVTPAEIIRAIDDEHIIADITISNFRLSFIELW